MLPDQLKQLSLRINALPGITKKQSEKLALNLLTKYKNETNEFIKTYEDVKKIVKNCDECGNIATDKLCLVCQDLNKDRRKILIIVESPLDISKFEESEVIKGFYHVLDGLIKVDDDDSLEKLNTHNLVERAKKFNEIILALSSNLEGIVTANYIRSLLGNQKVTQLAQGIPIGSAMEYVDQFTLKSAINNRKEIK